MEIDISTVQATINTLLGLLIVLIGVIYRGAISDMRQLMKSMDTLKGDVISLRERQIQHSKDIDHLTHKLDQLNGVNQRFLEIERRLQNHHENILRCETRLTETINIIKK